MASREEAQKVARKLHALSGGAEILRKAAARELATRHPVDANELIQHLLELTREGWEPARRAIIACVTALGMETEIIPEAEQLRRLANVQSLAEVEALFADGRALMEMDPGAAAKADARNFNQSLGHLKQRARLTRNPDELTRLAQASNPSVVRNALLNPRLTEGLVVRMAAKRPARPEPLREIWMSAKWSTRPAVRRALVLNPYLPPEIGTKIVPTLGRADWEQIASQSGLHPSIREQARLMLADDNG